jgi:hypothetical protein
MELAMPAVFGKGGGCALVKDSCAAFVKANPLQNYYCPAARREADQCTFDYKGIGVCVEGVDDGCLLAGASVLRGLTLTCGSTSSWSTMRHQAFFYHHMQAGGTVGSQTARCFAVDPSTKVCQRPPGAGAGGRNGSAAGEAACLMREGMCLDVSCNSRGLLSATFKFPDGSSKTLPCPTGERLLLVCTQQGLTCCPALRRSHGASAAADC